MMDDEKLKKFQSRLMEVEAFLEETINNILGGLPDKYKETTEFERLYRLSIKSAGIQRLIEVLQEYGPSGVIFMIMHEGETAMEAMSVKKLLANGEGMEKCAECEDREDCPIAEMEGLVPPTNEEGCKLLH